jgi:hypothetical protein
MKNESGSHDNAPAGSADRTSDSKAGTNSEKQRHALLDAQRKAHEDDNRGVKNDALTDKVITVEPDGTGPTPTESFDPEADQSNDTASGGSRHPAGTKAG